MRRTYRFYLYAFFVLLLSSLPSGAQETEAEPAVPPFWPSSLEEVIDEDVLFQDIGNTPVNGVAPFGDPDADKPLMGQNPKSLLNLYKRNTRKKKTIDALGEAHKTPSQMKEWVVIAASDLLSFRSKEAEQRIRLHKGLFVGKAYNDYKQSLEKQGLINILRGKFIQINAVVEEDPFLLYEGVRGERYRWHYEFPVMLTVFDQKTASHKSKKKETLRYQIRLEIIRVPESVREDGVLIEKWKISRIR